MFSYTLLFVAILLFLYSFKDNFQRTTFRQTQVLVIPSNAAFTSSFEVFDNLIQAINQARKNAKGLITDASLEKTSQYMYGLNERDWR
jgi:hypothetical protein